MKSFKKHHHHAFIFPLITLLILLVLNKFLGVRNFSLRFSIVVGLGYLLLPRRKKTKTLLRRRTQIT